MYSFSSSGMSCEVHPELFLLLNAIWKRKDALVQAIHCTVWSIYFIFSFGISFWICFCKILHILRTKTITFFNSRYVYMRLIVLKTLKSFLCVFEKFGVQTTTLVKTIPVHKDQWKQLKCCVGQWWRTCAHYWTHNMQVHGVTIFTNSWNHFQTIFVAFFRAQNIIVV